MRHLPLTYIQLPVETPTVPSLAIRTVLTVVAPTTHEVIAQHVTAAVENVDVLDILLEYAVVLPLISEVDKGIGVPELPTGTLLQ